MVASSTVTSLQLPSVSISLSDLATRFGVAHQGQAVIRSVASLNRARADQIAFLANSKYTAQLATTQAGAVIIEPKMASDATARGLPTLLSPNPYALFAKIATLLSPLSPPQPGVHPSAVVDPSARLGANVSIGPGCVIGADVQIGADGVLDANVTVYARSVIGARALIHSGAVIGADGFGMAQEDGRWLKIPQIGRAVLGDDVEVGANTCIDRGALDNTVVGDGVKLDNLIQIGHGATIGAHTAIAAGVVVAGSAHIGARCTIRVGAIVLGHFEIANDVVVSGATMVTRAVREASTVTGAYPAEAHDKWLKNTAQLRRLEKLNQRVKALEQALRKKSPEPHFESKESP